MRKYGTPGAVFFLLLILVLLVFSLTSISHREEPLTYTQLLTLLHSGKTESINKVIVTNGESTVQVKMAGSERERSVIVPIESKESLINELNKSGITLDVREPDKSSFWFSMLSSFFLPILIVGWIFIHV